MEDIEEEQADQLPLDISKALKNRNSEEGEQEAMEDKSALAQAVSQHTLRSEKEQHGETLGISLQDSAAVTATNSYATYAAAYFNLGVSFEYLGKYDLAVQAF